MKKHPSHSFDDAGQTTQPDYVRDLLDAGRADHSAHAGYDVEAGLARHVMQVQMGAPTPDWAQGLVKGAGVAATGAGAGAAATGAKLLPAKLLPWIALPLITAGVISAIVIGAPSKAPVTRPSKTVAAPANAPLQGSNTAHEANGTSEAIPEVVFEVPADVAPTHAAGSADDVLARVKRDVVARRAAARAAQMSGPSGQGQTSSAKSVDTRSVDALMQRSADTSSQGSVKLAPRTTESAAATRAQGEQASEQASEQAIAGTEAKPTEQARTVAPAPIDDSRLEREMGMLAMAQRVLQTDPERALRLARQGEQEFSGSMFTQERQQVLLLALIQLGRVPEAKRLALPYLKRYPNGPFSDRLRRALVTGKLATESARDVNN